MFLYLEKEEYVKTWLDGGEIPLSIASSYKSDYRGGVFTPDEVKQFEESGIVDEEEYRKLVNFDNSKGQIGINRVRIRNNQGKVVAEDLSVTQYFSDALIFCVSTKCSKEQSIKFKKPYCIEILDFQKLNEVFD